MLLAVASAGGAEARAGGVGCVAAAVARGCRRGWLRGQRRRAAVQYGFWQRAAQAEEVLMGSLQQHQQTRSQRDPPSPPQPVQAEEEVAFLPSLCFGDDVPWWSCAEKFLTPSRHQPLALPPRREAATEGSAARRPPRRRAGGGAASAARRRIRLRSTTFCGRKRAPGRKQALEQSCRNAGGASKQQREVPSRVDPRRGEGRFRDESRTCSQ